MKNIFEKSTTEEVIARIEKLTATTSPLWGKMTVSQMLAHCCVTYEMLFEPERFPKPNFLMGLMLKFLVKPTVTGSVPYKKNSRTAPAFLITEDKDFETERKRLIEFLQKVHALGENYFDDRESHSFGKLSKEEWSTMFYKHLDHHLGQFGV
ncbi:MAG: DUF1569 domain-containing protein [Cytophagaceae bacterium]|nr:DUF1569 domain-containing protein [Cytophagaceae bacterium]MBK9933542.1 DUF1569 domain-containing protein [Cytophagaceae bacterium]MBL0302744.1 DUF1569 domain-containing protein [Cytophagaceae bacterium]MBL0325566.1 DUF1569 domain-containing protein [Cytophagaceae bacterium]